MITALRSTEVRKICDPASLQAMIPLLKNRQTGIIGQDRAEKAFDMGLHLKSAGFNLYVSGEPGTGKLAMAQQFINRIAREEPSARDWCYVNNFHDPYQPAKLSLQAGQAAGLKKDMKQLVEEAKRSLMLAFESEEYAARKKKISDQFEDAHAKLMNAINEKARNQSLEIRQTPVEIFTVPLKAGNPMTEEEFKALPEKEQDAIRERQALFAEEIKSILSETRKLAKTASEKLSQLEKEVAAYAIGHLVEDIREKYPDLPDVLHYLDQVKNDILENLSEFLQPGKENIGRKQEKSFDHRYEINVLVENSSGSGAPIIIERNPTYNNLIGRVEKESVMGTLITDFTMIRKGSLHRANGGYLVIRAEELFRNLFSWEALKRALRSREILIEEATDQLGYLTTKTLRPEAIPLEVKVILIGSPWYYYLLYNYDPEFKELFKVKADFDSRMDRTEDNTGNYILFIQSLCEQEKLRPLQYDAMARLVEYGSRLANDQQKLSTRFAQIADIVREASHYAEREAAELVSAGHVGQAIEARFYRSNLIQEKINEMILQKQILIDIRGEKTGQVNGLAVVDLGDISFGKPNRITCSISLGKSGVMTIEREAELSGSLHTKGVLILTGYLTEKYFRDKPVSLSARLVFEQSYGMVEGDSASSTELYALLSGLSGLPVKQGIAVTGSVNQKGEIQAIGGVNEKIEGYFELCRQVGLTGEQGVIIPSANIRHLMLKEEIAGAVARQQFHIWAVDHIDDGIELLTGVRAGNPEEKDTVASLVNQTLSRFAEKLKSFDGELSEGHEIVWESSIV